MSKFYFLLLSLILNCTLNAQYKDLIVWNDSDKLYCELVSLNDEIVQFKLENSEFLQTAKSTNIDYVIFKGSKERIYIDKAPLKEEETEALPLKETSYLIKKGLKPRRALRPGSYWSIENSLGSIRGSSSELEISMGLSGSFFKKKKEIAIGASLGFYGFEPSQKKYILATTADMYYFPQKRNDLNLKVSMGYGFTSAGLAKLFNSNSNLTVIESRGGINASIFAQKTLLEIDKMRLVSSLGLGIQDSFFMSRVFDASNVIKTQDLLFIRFWATVGIVF